MKTISPPINVRLFDLVRFMRAELHEANLITDEEYAWLCMEAPLTQGVGSPSPRRLEDYDELRAQTAKLRDDQKEVTRTLFEAQANLNLALDFGNPTNLHVAAHAVRDNLRSVLAQLGRLTSNENIFP